VTAQHFQELLQIWCLADPMFFEWI